MTANRALREMTNDGYLERIAGVGTFIAEVRAESHLVEVRNIADDVADRGHVFSTKLLLQQSIKADPAVSSALMIPPDTIVYQSRHLHCEQGIPIQLEDRFVNPEVFPDYLKADLKTAIPNEYLMSQAVMERAEHIVSAIPATDELKTILQLDEGDPCLLLERKTWAMGRRASYARLYHPGNRHQLRDEFRPA